MSLEQQIQTPIRNDNTLLKAKPVHTQLHIRMLPKVRDNFKVILGYITRFCVNK